MGRGRCNCGGSGGDVNFSNEGSVDFSGAGTLLDPIIADVDLPQLLVDLGAAVDSNVCQGVTQVLGVVGGVIKLINLPTLRCRKML